MLVRAWFLPIVFLAVGVAAADRSVEQTRSFSRHDVRDHRTRQDIRDLDGNGLVDYVRVCDWDRDGMLDERDVQAGIAAIDDTHGTVDLCAGVFTIDANDNGRGDHGLAACGGDPHICIDQSGLTIRGQGPDSTILRKTTPIEDTPYLGMGDAEDAYGQSNVRLADIVIRDLAVEGPPDNCTSGPSAAKAFRFTDCDRCRGINLVARDLQQAAFDLTRCTDSSFIDSAAYRTGNYDHDGVSTACSPNPQPCVYLFTSDGFVTHGNLFERIVCDGVGGRGINVRTSGGVGHAVGAGPFGEDRLDLDGDRVWAAQVFKTDEFSPIRVTGVTLYLRAEPGSVGDLRLSLRAGGPDGPVVSGYDEDDFEPVPATELSEELTASRIRHRLATGYPPRLAPDTTYAIVIRRDGTPSSTVSVEWDDETLTDTYPDGDVWTSGSGVPGSFLLEEHRDLNFEIHSGWNEAATFREIEIRDVTGYDGQEPICVSLERAHDILIEDVTCLNAGSLNVARNSHVTGSHIRQVTSTSDETAVRSSAGLYLGSYAGGVDVEEIVIDGTPDGDYCTIIDNWARDVRIDSSTFRNCGKSGVRIGGGSRRIVIDDVEIENTRDNGVLLYEVDGDLRGADREHRGLVIRNSEIRGTGGHGIGRTISTGGYDDLRIVGNTFEQIGRSGIYLDTSSADEFGPVLIRDNAFRGWSVAAPGHAGVEFCQAASDVVVDANRLTSEGNEDSAIRIDLTESGDRWSVTDNIADGDYGDTPWVFLLRSGVTFESSGNVPEDE